MKQTLMKITPMLLTAEMYAKAEAELKTQTMRLNGLKRINKNPTGWFNPIQMAPGQWTLTARGHGEYVRGRRYGVLKCPFGTAGDRIYIKEPFRMTGIHAINPIVTGIFTWDEVGFKATLTDAERQKYLKWKKPFSGKSPLFMFKSLARLWLEIESVQLMRVQEITEGEAVAEGCQKGEDVSLADINSMEDSPEKELAILLGPGRVTAKFNFSGLWDSINAARGYPWAISPWVWVIKFKKLKGRAHDEI